MTRLPPSRRQACISALLPVALRAIECGELNPAWTRDAEAYARITANYAATDLILTGRTLLLPMAEVEVAIAHLRSPLVVALGGRGKDGRSPSLRSGSGHRRFAVEPPRGVSSKAGTPNAGAGR